MYQYKVVGFQVIDGDTVDLTLDLGFNICTTNRYRLYGPDPQGSMGLNAEERFTSQGKESTRWLNASLSTLLTSGDLVAHTIKDKKEKYGRYLVVLKCGEYNVNQLMVDTGHAVLKEYK